MKLKYKRFQVSYSYYETVSSKLNFYGIIFSHKGPMIDSQKLKTDDSYRRKMLVNYYKRHVFDINKHICVSYYSNLNKRKVSINF